MAERDFAQVEANHFEQRDNTTSSSKPLWITILATVFAMICFAVGFYMGEQHGVALNKGNKHEELIGKLQKQQQELESLKEDAQKWQAQEASTSQVGELTFYNELPEQSINPEPLDAKPVVAKDNSVFLDRLAADLAKNKEDRAKASAKTIEEAINSHMQNTTRTFKIQVASLRIEKDALTLSYKLESLGIPAKVQRVNLQEKGVYYRVYTKSYMKEQDAIQAKALIFQKLKMKGIMIQNG